MTRVWVPNVGDVAIGTNLTETIDLLHHGTNEQRHAAAIWLSCETERRALTALEQCVDTPGPVGIIARDALGLSEDDPNAPVTVYFEQDHARKGVLLERAVRNAKLTGKEAFDWDAFRASGCRPHGEAEHRLDYYVTRSEMRTMAEYIAHRKAMEPFE